MNLLGHDKSALSEEAEQASLTAEKALASSDRAQILGHLGDEADTDAVLAQLSNRKEARQRAKLKSIHDAGDKYQRRAV